MGRNLLAASIVMVQGSRLHPECPCQSGRTGREFRSVLVFRELRLKARGQDRNLRNASPEKLSFGWTKFRGAGQPIALSLESRHAYGIMAATWFENTLSFPLESTAVVT